MNAGRAASECRILALGDSYTIGEGVGETERWPERVAALLRSRGQRVAKPTIVARTGWTTDELAAGITAARVEGPYDLVTLLIGVNDQYRGRSVEAFEPRFRELLERAVRYAGGRADGVIVVAIPDWGVTPFAAGRDRAAIAAQIDAFNGVCAIQAAMLGARFVDVAPLARRAGADAALLAADGLHPSGQAYAEWAALILGEAIHALRAR